MSNFYTRLSYSFGNEDSKTENKALRITPQDQVLCITASGDRPLNLLINNCAGLTCVDVNKTQNHLLSLKVAALQTLDYPDYLAFLGAMPCQKRHHFYKNLLPMLDPETKSFWNHRHKLIEEGILYQGALEKWAKKISNTIRFFRKSKVDRLFSFDNLEEQKQFMRDDWNKWIWRKIFDFNLYPAITKLFLKDPALSFSINPAIKIGPYIYDRMSGCLDVSLAKSNSFLSLFMNGHVLPDAYPPYLTEKGTELIKSRVDRLTIKTHDIIQYLKRCPDNCFDVFSMSDVASYLGKKEFEDLLHLILRTAKPNARFSIRQFLSSHTIPHHLRKVFKREESLEKQLEKEDFCFIYNFMVGKISK